MRFDTPAGSNPIDRQKVLGQPIERIEGQLKTTGRATYAYEQHAAAPNAAYGFIVGAGVAKGVIEAMHIEEASVRPGVLAVITYANSGSFGPASFIRTTPLAGPEVSHYHQAVAFVVAESQEAARAALDLIRHAMPRATSMSSIGGRTDVTTSPSNSTAPGLHRPTCSDRLRAGSTTSTPLSPRRRSNSTKPTPPRPRAIR